MFTLVLMLITAITCLTALVRPWIGVCAYYTLSLLSPHYIWPWIFKGMPINMLVSACTLGGFLLAVLGRKVDLRRLHNVQTYALITLWIVVHLSNLISPYADYAPVSRMASPDFILKIFNTIILFHLIAIVVIDTEEKLKYLTWVLVGAAIYFIYWANMMYLTGGIWRHQVDGRLKGPGSIYSDTNAFALMFVVSMPFLFYLGHYAEQKWLKYGLWAAIPFLWHAAFLTGSRGGLLAMGVATLFIAWRFRSKRLSIVLLAALSVAVVDQGGTVLDRTEGTMAQRQAPVADEPLDPRILSWTTALKIVPDYPWLGVGVGRFQQAAPEYNYGKGLVAHNTLLQFTADSGLIAGACYLLIFTNLVRVYRHEHVPIGLRHRPDLAGTLREACSTALLAFFVGALFLNLMLFEPFYYLLAVSLILSQVSRQAGQLPKRADRRRLKQRTPKAMSLANRPSGGDESRIRTEAR